ncbi:hypothetical protein EDC26_102367 [Paralcaligenes ureilyticus]|uniref:Uncharacterized protein n=1 Tax=Paralcaligenes ureilyticus TaxID=627131 RepID=A0A4R3MAA9_9BURK|nr:hypothetical protein EDC26_102367 [Paralcaligenes ureilyticus]
MATRLENEVFLGRFGSHKGCLYKNVAVAGVAAALVAAISQISDRATRTFANPFIFL